MSHAGSDDPNRRRFVADPEVLARLGMSIDDLADVDVRSYAIGNEHPEFEDALDAGIREIDLGYGPINPRLRLAIHEIVATQLRPPEHVEMQAMNGDLQRGLSGQRFGRRAVLGTDSGSEAVFSADWLQRTRPKRV